MPQVVSANRLTDGIVVFLGAEGTWVEGLQQATLFEAADLAPALARAEAQRAANIVVEIAARASRCSRT